MDYCHSAPPASLINILAVMPIYLMSAGLSVPVANTIRINITVEDLDGAPQASFNITVGGVTKATNAQGVVTFDVANNGTVT